MFKKLTSVYLFAFVLNLIWENAHSFLYTNYQGAQITESVLLKAAAFDALFITGIFILFSRSEFLRRKIWLSFLIGVIFAIGLEIFALQTGRWQYNALMPIIPIIGTGLTPTLQLGLIGYFTVRIFLPKLHPSDISV